MPSTRTGCCCALLLLIAGCATMDPGDNTGPTLQITEDGYSPIVYSTIEGVTAEPRECENPPIGPYARHQSDASPFPARLIAKDPSGVEEIEVLIPGHWTVTDFGEATTEQGSYTTAGGVQHPATYVTANFSDVEDPIVLSGLHFRVHTGSESFTMFVTTTDFAGNDSHDTLSVLRWHDCD